MKQTSTPFEEGKKMDVLRKIYSRATSIPIHNVELIWKDYDAYENNLNKLTVTFDYY